MDFDLLDLYELASVWTGTKVRVAVAQLDAPTTCEPWIVMVTGDRPEVAEAIGAVIGVPFRA
jgi:cation transport ATPase